MKCNTRFFKLFTDDGIGFFRLFGVGIGWKDITRHGLMFSERSGYWSFVMLGKWMFKLLYK